MMLITMIRTLTSSQGQPAGALRGPKFAHTESKEAVSRQTHQALSPRGSTGGYMSKERGKGSRLAINSAVSNSESLHEWAMGCR
jgi:hypothetical protein